MDNTNETAEPSGASGGSLAWIPVTERLPEADAEVLVAWSSQTGSHVDAAYLRNDGFWRSIAGHTLGVVTHWTPLPAPPPDFK